MLFTVAVAAYNCEHTLDECVQSILAQTCPDFELLLIDDGSSDETSSICDQWALLDERIRVIHQLNSGLSAVRNKSIKEAKGELLVFADADDIFYPDALAGFYSVWERGHFDICFGGVVIENNGHTHHARILTHQQEYLSSESRELVASCLLEGLGASKMKSTELSGAAWGKAYRTAFLHDNDFLFDSRLNRAQDIHFNLLVVFASECIAQTHNAVYEYRIIEGSKSHTDNPRLLDDFTIFLTSIREVLQQYNSERLSNDYYFMAINLLIEIVRRGGLINSQTTIEQILRELSHDSIFLEAISKVKIRSPYRLKENIKVFLFKQERYSLLSKLLF